MSTLTRTVPDETGTPRSATGPRPRPPKPARMRPADLGRVGMVGLRTRPMRAVLSALGIAIGIAAMVAVVGISSSSKEDLNRFLDSLGTNLLSAAPGQDLFGNASKLPPESVDMVRRIDAVEEASSVGKLTSKVYRSDRIPEGESGGIGTYAADLDLPGTTGAEIAEGRWLTPATSSFPAAVLGAKAAERLGVTDIHDDALIRVGDQWFTVVGILKPIPLASDLDTGVFVGRDAARDLLGWDGKPTTLYARTDPDRVHEARDLIGAMANPEAPHEVKVSRPSDALAAQEATDQAFTGLLLGLGAVALLVGGIGVANTMIISVLERRSEIGLRRALGATRGNVRTQFLVESLLLSLLGGIGGVVIGYGITALYASLQGWPTVVPLPIALAGIGITVLTGAVAGLYPAMRAARLSPTEALAGGS